MTQRIPSRRIRVGGCASVIAAYMALSGGAGVASGSRAVASRTFTLNESGSLHRTSHHGFTINEQGTASGTIKGTIYIHLTITSTKRVTAEVNIYPKGGSITGHASAAYRSQGPTASFSGTMSVTRGTGSYNHAHGSGLSFSGTIKRINDAVTVHTSGTLST